MKKQILALLFGIALLTGGTVASADTITQTYTYGPAVTSWSQNAVFNLFNGSGTLNSVKFDLQGTAFGNIFMENRSPSAGDLNGSITATLSLMRPDSTLIVNVIPVAQQAASVGAFDGVIDYAGSSGVSYLGVSNNLTSSAILTNPADLLLFTGAGTITLNSSGTAISNATGPGSVASLFDTYAGEYITLTYDYTPASTVPEPGTFFMLGAGLLGAGAFIRLRRKK